MVNPQAPASLIVHLGPIFIVLLFCGTIGIIFYASGQRAYAFTEPYTRRWKEQLERAGMTANADKIGYSIFGGTLLLWIAVVFTFPLPLLATFFMLPALLVTMVQLVGRWVNIRISRRQSAFVAELENVLRVMSSGVRAGLTIRQALVLVTEEAREPARYEFKLMIVQTNVGVSMNDALNRLAARMPSPEVLLFTRTVILQSTTGGNLAKVLDQLCDTIKERRRIFRKVRTITSEARGSAWVLGALPLVAFGLILVTLPDFRYPTFHSAIGLGIIGAASVLEALCGFVLYKLTQFKV